jgi:hypothetical protein
MGVAYGGAGAYAGPTLAGCTATADSITVRFNTTLLRGGAVGVKPYDQKTSFSAMRVLIDAKYWCENTTITESIDGNPVSAMCNDLGAPDWGRCGTDVQCFTGGIRSSDGVAVQPHAKDGADAAGPSDVWVLVDVKSKSATEVTLDLSRLPKGAAPIALRYAWDNEKDTCCASA